MTLDIVPQHTGATHSDIAFVPLFANGRLGVPVVFTREDDGWFSVVTPSLPGACAQGATSDEARDQIRLVLQDVVRHAESGRLPFATHDVSDAPAGVVEIVWLDA